ncbi:Fc.00g050190.m01.CDS01 [Cosmosporella sp. VM-42]
MASDDYSVVSGGGALKLKGAKVQKKKKKKDKSNLEKNISSGEKALVKKSKSPEEEKPDEQNSDDERPAVQKTESERRHEEIKRKRLLQMAEASGSRPELLKTHKERVEELNTYLSKLSEHHDMPKIGPG